MTELTGIGAELRRAREAQGLAVADVAQQLKFATRQIESLENERFDRLPGPTIARGMVRNYARLLNLDPEPLVSRMLPAAEPPPDARGTGPALKPPVAFSDGGRRSTLAYAGFSVAVLALAGLLAYEWQQERAAPQFVAPVQPQRAPEPEPEPVAAPTPPQQPQPQVVVEAPKAEPKKTVEKPAPEAPAAKPQAEAPPAKPEAEAPLKVATGNLHRIELICQEESWIEVKDGTGRSLVSSLNTPGSQRLVRGRGPFEIVIGNASGVTLLVDGKPVNLAPHTRGEVARVTIE